MAAPAEERLEHVARGIAAGMPRPRSITRTVTRPDPTPAVILTGSVRRRELDRVLDQVREHALELRGVGADQREVVRAGRTRSGDRCAAGPAAEATTSCRSHQSGLRRDRAGLDLREVEQVVDELAPGVRPRPRSPRSARSRSSSVMSAARSAEPAVGDRGQRRAQVMGDRVEDRGAGDLGPAAASVSAARSATARARRRRRSAGRAARRSVRDPGRGQTCRSRRTATAARARARSGTRDLAVGLRRHRLEHHPGSARRRVARATRPPMLSSWVATLCPARIADAASASSVASRSRAVATRARLSASAARWRPIAASRPTTTAAIISTTSSTKSCEWAIASWWRGVMKR